MIAIIGAQDQEINAIRELMSNVSDKDLFGYQCYIGQINQQEVILAKSKVGGVACSVLMTLLLSNYPIRFVYNVGTAGSYQGANTKPYDIIVAEQLGYYDTDLTLFPRYQYGQMAECPRFFTSSLVGIDQIKAHDWPFNVKFGTILSGDKFVNPSQDVLAIIAKEFRNDNILALDMESTYFAQACYIFNKPFLVLRIVSDIIDSEEQRNSYETVLEVSSQYYAQILARII